MERDVRFVRVNREAGTAPDGRDEEREPVSESVCSETRSPIDAGIVAGMAGKVRFLITRQMMSAGRSCFWYSSETQCLHLDDPPPRITIETLPTTNIARQAPTKRSHDAPACGRCRIHDALQGAELDSRSNTRGRWTDNADPEVVRCVGEKRSAKGAGKGC